MYCGVPGTQGTSAMHSCGVALCTSLEADVLYTDTALLQHFYYELQLYRLN